MLADGLRLTKIRKLLGLRPREAAGAVGEAGRWRSHHQGRRRHRDRDEGEEGARRGRDARHEGGGRRGHRRRRRSRPAARKLWRSTPWRSAVISSSGCRSCAAPSRRRCGISRPNAGAEGSIVVAKVKDMKLHEGFNAATETYEDLVAAGVIDPAKGRAQRTTERRVRVIPSVHDRDAHFADSRSERRWRPCPRRDVLTPLVGRLANDGAWERGSNSLEAAEDYIFLHHVNSRAAIRERSIPRAISVLCSASPWRVARRSTWR